MDRLSRVPIFVAVARHGSFAEAARRLGMTGSASEQTSTALRK